MIYCQRHLGLHEACDGEFPPVLQGTLVWETRELAETECPMGYGVFVVLANWETDTFPNALSRGNARELKIKTIIVQT